MVSPEELQGLVRESLLARPCGACVTGRELIDAGYARELPEPEDRQEADGSLHVIEGFPLSAVVYEQA